jgi:L-lactate utilization protein LutB
MTQETRIKSKIKKYLESIGAWHWSHSERYGKGYPDIEFILAGRTVRLEVKATKGRADVMQRLRIEQIRKAGGEAYFVDSVEDVRSIVNNIITDRHLYFCK